MDHLDILELRLDQKHRRRTKRKHPPMKVSGKSVFTLRQILIKKGKKARKNK